MVERYLPGVTAQELDEAGERLAAAARRLATEGVAVRYSGSTFLPEEESCFCTFDAASADDVRRACGLAGISFARVVETHDFAPVKEGE
jgi:hypothetical protein